MNGMRFARTAREAFGGGRNPVFSPRRSTMSGPFKVTLRERVLQFLRSIFR